MANRKEYEMLFALNAQMSGGFHSTFTKAQARFAELDNEIRNLQKNTGKHIRISKAGERHCRYRLQTGQPKTTACFAPKADQGNQRLHL